MAEGSFCPYVGLRPYDEHDRVYFFGRERELRSVADSLFGARITVFYGASGVGKSSVLMAGVVPELRAEPRTAIVVFRSWQVPNAAAQLKRDIAAAAAEVCGRDLGGLESLPLDDMLKRCAEEIDGTVLLILDQFEEFFLYFKDPESGFDAELARAITRRDVDAGFVISLREDSLSKLDRLKKRVPNLLATMLRLSHLRIGAAKRALVEPLAVYNKRRPEAAKAEDKVDIEPELVQAVLEQTAPGQLSLAGAEAVPREAEVEEGRVEAPFLQLVMERLWSEEIPNGSRRLRLSTLARLGGAQTIVRTHLREVLSGLSADEQELCARVFDRLVTPSGAKVAVRLKDLKSYAGDLAAKVPQLTRVLDQKRILARSQAPPGEPEDNDQYQIIHDVMAAGVLDWRTRFVEARKLEEMKASAAAALAQRRARLFKLWAAPAIIALAVVSGLMLYLYLDAEEARGKAEEARGKAEEARGKAEEALAREKRAREQQDAINALWAERRVEGQMASTKAEPASSSQAQVVASKSLVYLQFVDPGQKALAERLRAQLDKESRYRVPGVQQVGAAPSRTELRYFRPEDEPAAGELADLLKEWNFGGIGVRLVKGYESSVQLKQFEIWLAASDPGEIRRLIQSLDAPVKDERLAAGQLLQTRYTASQPAITEALALFRADRIASLSATGRINALYFLSRTAPLAWDAELQTAGRAVVAVLESREAAGVRMGDDTRAELGRLIAVLDAAKAGEPAPREARPR